MNWDAGIVAGDSFLTQEDDGTILEYPIKQLCPFLFALGERVTGVETFNTIVIGGAALDHPEQSIRLRQQPAGSG